jgi:hypothetical protein
MQPVCYAGVQLAGEQRLASLPETIDDQPPLPVPETCPVTLDELLSDPP